MMFMGTSNIDNTSSTKPLPKRENKRLGFGLYFFVIIGLSVFAVPIIYLFFVLYFIDTTYSFFLVLAVLGILFYVWALYHLLKDPQKTDPIVRIKGKEYSLWGALIVVSFCVLITYYLVCGAVMLFDKFANNDLSWRIFNIVCSSKLFWWITSMGMIIHIIAWVEREIEIKHAFSRNHQSNENLKEEYINED